MEGAGSETGGSLGWMIGQLSLCPGLHTSEKPGLKAWMASEGKVTSTVDLWLHMYICTYTHGGWGGEQRKREGEEGREERESTNPT